MACRPRGPPCGRPAGLPGRLALAGAVWGLLLLVRPAGAFFAELDPRKFTCLLPIGEQQALAESAVWQILLRSAERRFEEDLEDMGKDLRPDIEGHVMPELQRHVAPNARASAQDLGGLLKLVDREVADECAHIGGLGSLSGQVQDAAREALDAAATAAAGASRSLLASEDADAGATDALLHAGEDCWEQCGGKSGKCASGFCGGGACCKRWEFHPECPLGVRGGCGERHCCVALPANISGLAAEQRFCNATPGSYCLSTMLLGHEDGFSAAQLCALQQTLMACPPGFYCVGGRESPRACPRAVRCPMASKEPLPCPEGHFCPISIVMKACPSGLRCGVNSDHPDLCEAGTFCPDGITQACPPGHFCAPGAVEPAPCALLSRCPPGSSFPLWDDLARPALVAALLSWTAAVRSVPTWVNRKGGVRAALPALVTVASLCAAWAARADLLYNAVKQLVPSAQDPVHLQIQALVGGVPHTMALLFLTLTYVFLLYGLFASVRIHSPTVQRAADAAVCVAMGLGLAAYMQDKYAVLFMGNIWAAFKVVWVLLLKQGPFEFRVGLLAAVLLGLTAAFLMCGAPELAQLLLVALLGAGAKELLLHWCLPALTLAVRARRKRSAESALSDTPFRPLINSLTVESIDTDSSVRDIVTAACITAGARASLQAHRAAGSSTGEGDPDSPRPLSMDPDAWAPWAAHRSGGGGLGGSFQEGGSSASSSSGQPGVSFELRGVSYRVGERKKLLQDLTFMVPGGTMVAVMGASGSGKTTLLSVLSGRCGDGRFLGELRLNGTPKLPWQMAELRSLVGYVPQDDVMHAPLTVAENIEFQAELRLVRRQSSSARSPRGRGGAAPDAAAAWALERQELRERVDAVIYGLGLALVRDRVVAEGLSGGQRKRVSIGMEVVSRPRVLLLDEPSTGLDSSTSHRILEMVLSTASAEHCTTFATIHQPRWPTLTLFGMLVLLAPGGHLCYAGPVAAVKAYFTGALSLDFPEDENPADIIIDACTFDSGRRMAVEGLWRSPPQVLRAVLIPTPEAEALSEESRAPWQQDTFGRMLTELWQGFSAALERYLVADAGWSEGASASASSSDAWGGGRRARLAAESPASSGADDGDGLADEARERADIAHWGQQVWIHVARSLLILSRELWPTVALHIFLLMVTMVALAWAFPGGSLQHIFLQNGLMLLLLCLSQSVAAQRVFGGEERHVAWREASVSSLRQVMFTFVGKDIASLVEISLASMVFTLTYWPVAHTYASAADLFEIGFSTLYCVWGLNHILSISLPASAAMLVAVIVSFLSFLFCGLRPEARVISRSLGGYGSLLLLVSPVRWAMSHWLFRHVTGGGATYAHGAVQDVVDETFTARGFSIRKLACPDGSAPVAERWADDNGWVCHSGQLFLLGFHFRFLAAMCLLLTSSANASGGQLSLGASSIRKSRLMRDGLLIVLAFLTLLNLLFLGRTY